MSITSDWRVGGIDHFKLVMPRPAALTLPRGGT